ncbi:hypothetical protein ACH42_02220 [Endozoicomonas sp. (ex Bugula neritina AB1)]|nr:hypothetical protein ACH42_02220 [Endozoicomonas sp. (ex Bugula neritina AB1)]
MTITLSALLPVSPTTTLLSGTTDNLMGAVNDSEALTLFLNKAGARSEETFRRYEREIVRFTAYLYRELQVDYAGVRLKHLQTYLHFIQNLPEHWRSPGVLPGKPERILFKESIKQGKSTDQVIDVLSTFFTFLERNRYTSGNPAASLVRSGEKVARGNTTIRYFYDNEWAFVKECLQCMPVGTQKQIKESIRTRYILSISYALALRESEVTNHSCSDIHPDGEGGYYLSVLGKGRKRRRLPINRSVQTQIESYRDIYSLEGLIGDDFPLAPRTRKSKGRLSSLSSRGLRFWWQSFMSYCASQTSDTVLASRLKSIPFHSLRHTALTHLAKRMDIEDLAIFAGHDSINTTSQYYHAEMNRLKNMASEHHI